MKPPTDATGNRCPIVAHNMGIPSFAIQCEREAGHKGDHVSGGCIWADEDARIAPHHPEDVVLVYPPPGDGSAFRAAAKVAATVCNPPETGNQCMSRTDIYGPLLFCSKLNNHDSFHRDNATGRTWTTDLELLPRPSQCPSVTVDRAVSMDTRCRQPEGHEGPHGDGCMTWEDEEPCDAVDALQTRIAAILGDRTTDSGVLNFALILDMAERAQDFEDDFARVKAEDHAGDEVHCSCVIHLRRHIEELKAEIAALKQPFSLHIDPDGERVWRRGEQCRHERTYTAEATICRQCNKVV